MPTKDDLQYYQAMPLFLKIAMTKQRIREWVREYGTDGVYVSFSGGKDSTVLLHIVREMYPDIEAVFVNTGLEYPEIQKFVKTFDNVTILRPKMRFDEVIKKYGYPVISKEVSETVGCCQRSCNAGLSGSLVTTRWQRLRGEHVDKDGNVSKFNQAKWLPLVDVDFRISDRCCGVMKKAPAKKYAKQSGKVPITGQMASESRLRTQQWLKNGCNGFDMKNPISNPMSFWTEQDVLQYIKENNLPIASVYGSIVYANDPDQMRLQDYGIVVEGEEQLATTDCSRTGCIFCAFGCHLEKEPSRFQRLKETHPRQYEYCICGGEYVDGVWKPNKQGLGMGHVFDELNKIYGDGFIKY